MQNGQMLKHSRDPQAKDLQRASEVYAITYPLFQCLLGVVKNQQQQIHKLEKLLHDKRE